MIASYGLLLLLLGGVMALSVVLKKLTLAGALTGGVLGLGIYAGAGFAGIAWLGAFFFLGIAATAHKQHWKESAGISTKNESRRTAGQVVANGGVAGLLGFTSLLGPQYATVFQVMMAACLASAAADTVSSELGVVYGRRFYNIRTLKKDQRGLDGVISWEGSLLGMGGSLVIALLYTAWFGMGKAMFWILVAGTLGNIADSYLGATLERTHRLNNNAVNFLNTLLAALVALVLYKV